MIELKLYLENKLREIISSWKEDDAYAISFFVSTNISNTYCGYSNVTEFFVSYNTEEDCEHAEEMSERRWNYAFWRQNESAIIEADAQNEGIKILFDWYAENGINNIGYEDYTSCYDDKMRYIGKGPIGCIELIQEITAVAQKLHVSGFIKEKFGRAIPIIIHDLEYTWYTIEATRKANINGEANMFLDAVQQWGQ